MNYPGPKSSAGDQAIEFPVSSRGWFMQLVFSTIAALIAYQVNPWLALACVVGLQALYLSRSAVASIDLTTRTLRLKHRSPLTFWRPKSVDLSSFTLIYSQIESYGARSLHLTGARGEHLQLAYFHQDIRTPNLHIEELEALRARLAYALKIRDGGEK